MASGVRWIAAGTLPEAPDMRPSVTRATLRPRSCSTARVGVRLCSSGMPLAFGPWKRTTATKSRSSSPRLKAAISSSCSSNTMAGASTVMCWGLSAEVFITARPRLPVSSRMPPSAWNGSSTGLRMSLSSEVWPPSRQTSLPSSRKGSCWKRRRPAPATVSTSSWARPWSSNWRTTKAMPPAAWKAFTSALPFG